MTGSGDGAEPPDRTAPEIPRDVAAAVALGGDMGKLIEAHDWSAHALGPIASWSASKRAIVAAALTSRFPIVVWLDDPLYLVYNDAYAQILGDKHPIALGAAGRDVWWEIWDIIGPMLDGVMTSGVATWSDDQRLVLYRYGRPEEGFFTFTYSPIIGGAGDVEGVFCAVHETTERVLGERRLRTLRDLGQRLAEAERVDQAAEIALSVCATNPADLPFVAIYRADIPTVGHAPLVGATGDMADMIVTHAPSIDSWREPGRLSAREFVTEVGTRLPALGRGDDGQPNEAFVLPLLDTALTAPEAWLVIGVSPLRPFDASYESFCRLVGGSISTAFANARAYELERERSEALAALDRAKTEFFNNVSHEFRTPLTLLLGPLDDAIGLTVDDAPLTEHLQTARNNALRLLRLVNSLLDFSRVESGRSTARFVRTDVGALTTDVAHSFAEVIERGGLRLETACEPAPAFVDREKWETIVLNLLSNAFKFTLEGTITARVEVADDGSVLCTVSDTGTGIEPEDLPHVFERFYRPSTSQGRSYEGTGIGLALVRELVELHGGEISIASAPGAGTTVSVRLRPGSSHLADAQVADEDEYADSERAVSYVVEAQQWVDAGDDRPPDRALDEQRAVVLIADDNADMRRHLRRTLAPYWNTILATNGRQALELIREHRPDLVLADVMMPALNGFGLLAAVRADARLSATPVILLSARAGMEAAVEGMARGADDYIVKPFASGELIGRVAAQLQSSAERRREQEDEDARQHDARQMGEYAGALNEARSTEAMLAATLEFTSATLGSHYACVGILDADRALMQSHHAGANSTRLNDRYHLVSVDAPVPGAEAVSLDRSVVIEDLVNVDTRFASVAQDAADSGLRGAIFAPMHDSAGAVLGVLIVAWPSPMTFDAEQVAKIETCATMVGRTVERLQVVDREHRIATELQEQLLEVEFHSTAAAVSARYEPAVETLRVGGDWYTAQAIDDNGRAAYSVGDVVGHGLHAAAVMGQLRSALGAAAVIAADPSAVLDVVSRYARDIPDAACATVAYVLVDRDRDVLDYACAGHPFPLVVTPAGEPQFLRDARRPPLGFGPPTDGSTGSCEFPTGSMLVLYTDGLVERRDEVLDEGFARLSAAAARAHALPACLACDDLVRTMTPPGGFADDVAVVVVRPVGATPTTYVDSIRANFDQLPGARHRLADWLREGDGDDVEIDEMLLAVGEAVNNAITHGSASKQDPTVTIEAIREPDAVLFCISDSGRWTRDTAQSRRTGPGGLGLTIIHDLMHDVEIRRSRLGTNVVMRHATSGTRVSRGPRVGMPSK